jgi:hypothetical protein
VFHGHVAGQDFVDIGHSCGQDFIENFGAMLVPSLLKGSGKSRVARLKCLDLTNPVSIRL